MTFSERTEVGLARFFSNRGSRGGAFSIHTLIMSQLPDISETITVAAYFVPKTFPGKLGLLRVLAHQALEYIGGFVKGAQRAPLLIRLGTFNVQSRFFFPTVAVQEWPKPKAAIQIRFHLNQLGERPREGLSGSLLPNPENLTKEKGGVSGLRETQRNPEEFLRIFSLVPLPPPTHT